MISIQNMLADGKETGGAGGSVVRLGVMALLVVAAGLPLNSLFVYALLTVAAVLVWTGVVSRSHSRWLMAMGIAALALVLRIVLAPPAIEEGHNVFLPKDGGALQRELPPDVYRLLQAEFDAQYPVAKRCDPAKSTGCWQAGGFPQSSYAFSADNIFFKPAYSRTVTAIDFSDAVRLRLGFANDNAYNWYSDASDIIRSERDRRIWAGYKRWQITMPWYVMVQLPSSHVGSDLCWRGNVMWENAERRYELVRHDAMTCRRVEQKDAGRKIFGLSIKPASLAMKLKPTFGVAALSILQKAILVLAFGSIVALLVRVNPRAAVKPAVLIISALAAMAVNDATIITGLRPFESGDDGLYYWSAGRDIVQHVLHGNLLAALEGGEKIYYYGGPGLRYLRALEMTLFGDTTLGYLSIVLVLPFIVWGLLRRFLSGAWAWPLVFIFTLLPLGEVFGTSFIGHAKWATRGFADAAAHIFLVGGVLVMVGLGRFGPSSRFLPAFGGALLCALGIFMKPIVAPMAAVMLGGCGLAALYLRQWPRLTGMCLGFTPVLLMPLHNWYFGNVFVLFSANASHPLVYVMPPSDYLRALFELVRVDLGGEHLRRAVVQMLDWLGGPAQHRALVPLHMAAVGIVIYVAARGRRFDPWLRLIAAAVIAEYLVALFYVSTPRYFLSMWLLTGVVTAAWAERHWPLVRLWWRTKRPAGPHPLRP